MWKGLVPRPGPTAYGLAIALLAQSLAFGGPPDLELNTVTGYLESVDKAEESGSLIRHVIDKGQGKDQITTWISADAGDSPRIAITSEGTTWAAWWKDGSTDQVVYRHRTATSNVWSSETVISSSGEDSRSPEIVHNGTATWIAFEIVGGSSRSVAASGIVDTPEPFPQRTIIATTSFSGDLDTLIHSESGHVWVTWVDSTTQIGWSEYNAATELWALPQYRSYVSTTVETIRNGIRDTVVLGQ